MRVWEIARKPKYVVTKKALLTYVRSLFKESSERIIPVVRDKRSSRLVGFVTWIEAIMVTSHRSNMLVGEVARGKPVLVKDMDVREAYDELVEEKVWAAPVVDDIVDEKLFGVLSMRDIIKALRDQGIAPKAESVAEVMTTEGLDEMLVTPDERVNRVWSKFVYRALPAIIVVRSKEEPIPVGIATPKDFVDSGKWFFHRESESHIVSPAKISRVMTRGVIVATKDTPVDIVANIMIEHDFTLLPVVDENGHVIGVVTQADIARAYLEGAKPGRVPIPVIRLPKPVEASERVTYITSDKALEQVSVAKPVVETYIGVRAENIALEEMPAIRITDTIEHARKEMLRRRTNYLIVLDEAGEIVGYVSKWSMLKAIATKGPIWHRRVYDRFFIDYILVRDVPRVKPDTPIEQVAYEMLNRGSEIAFVVDVEGNIIGYITKDVIVEAYAKSQAGRALVENIMTPGRIGVVHPHHSLHHVITRMQTFMLDALAVYDGKIRGVISANRLPFMAYEDAATGIKTRRLIWVRKLVKGAARLGRYVKVLPLVAVDVMVPLKETVFGNEDVVKVIELMNKHNVDGIPVVDKDEQLLGIVCKNDILRELARTARLRIEITKKAEKRRRIGA